MQEVATIEPFGCNPGLVAFLCAECGSTNSILVHPLNQVREVDRKQQEQFLSSQ
jgi:hypothetical protein